jgi:hypothetical protein
VRKKESSTGSSQETVSGGIGLDELPFAKMLLGSYGSRFGWSAISFEQAVRINIPEKIMKKRIFILA